MTDPCCPCESFEQPEPLNSDGEICPHPDVCGCDDCECSCHVEQDDDDGLIQYEAKLDRIEFERSDLDYGFSAYD